MLLWCLSLSEGFWHEIGALLRRETSLDLQPFGGEFP